MRLHCNCGFARVLLALCANNPLVGPTRSPQASSSPSLTWSCPPYCYTASDIWARGALYGTAHGGNALSYPLTHVHQLTQRSQFNSQARSYSV